MTDIGRDGFTLRDEDRLPWLEPVDDADDVERPSAGRLIGLVLMGLAVLALAIGGIWWWQNRDVAPSGTGELIAAPPGPYKVKPDEPGGMEVEGKGEAAFATSEGEGPTGSLDLGAVPEEPVQRAAPVAKAAAPAGSASAEVAEGGRIVAKAPPVADAAPAGPAGSVVQLGAYDSQAVAKEAWTAMSKRFAYLDGLGQIIVPAKVGGRTFYRLRAAAGSPERARDVCARLKVAGENCLIVN